MSTIIEGPISLLLSSLMQRSLITTFLVGLPDPVMGTYLVHRYLAMLDDGIGHVSPTGVAPGWLAGTFASVIPQDSWVFPSTMIVSVLGAIAIELICQSGHTSVDVVLVIPFYRGITGGVLLIGLAGGTPIRLSNYLFGSIAAVTWDDILIISTLSAPILLVGVGIAPAFFSVTNDEDFAHPTGLPMRGLLMAIATLSTLTVAITMHVVGSLLVSALMVIFVAIVQFNARFFMTTMAHSMVYGALICTTGLSLTYLVDLSSGASIVVFVTGIYALGFVVCTITDVKQRATCVRQIRVSVERPRFAYYNEPAERV